MESFILTAKEYADYQKSMEVIRKFNRSTHTIADVEKLQNAYKIQEEIFNKPRPRPEIGIAIKNIAINDVVYNFDLKPLDKNLC